MFLALVPGMLNPVTNHPLLTRASLDDQTKTKISIFGHFHLQASARVSADDWTILELKEDLIKLVAIVKFRNFSVDHFIGSIMLRR